MKICIWCLAVCFLARDTLAEKSADDYLNKCFHLSEYSHDEPQPEPDLECPEYRGNACCRPDGSLYFEEAEQWMNRIDYRHCAEQTGKTQLCQSCHDRFFDEICFFQCSPDTGPWSHTGNHNQSSTEAALRMPLCQSQCDDWWNACKDEYTCADNWYQGFDSSHPGLPKCRDGSECKKYSETWDSASDFCQKIFDNAYKVVPDSERCMKFSRGQTSGNAEVARYYAEQLAN